MPGRTASPRELAATFLSPGALPSWPPEADVPAFLATVAAEGIFGLLYERVRSGGAHRLPPALVDGLREGALRQVARELAQRSELQRLVAAIAACGVEMLLIKGAALAYDVYPDPAWRVRMDVDETGAHSGRDILEGPPGGLPKALRQAAGSGSSVAARRSGPRRL